MMTIKMDDWLIDPAWAVRMYNAKWNGVSFYEIVYATMERLITSFGEPLRHEANVLTNANAPTSAFPFTGSDMTRYLREGDFNYNQMPVRPHPLPPGPILIDVPKPKLTIRGPRATDVGSFNFARAGINAYWIELNYPYILDVGNMLSHIFSNSATGFARLEVFIGQSLIHEMLHNHGFDHPPAPGITYDPAHPYWRSFPEVAELAYYRLNQALFPGTPVLIP